jgi:GNAT superfamily N-acetyltransferase
MKPTVITDRQRAEQLLRSDQLSHLMSLKMLTVYPQACRTTVVEHDDRWACLTELDASMSHWDHRAYPQADVIAMPDGNDSELIRHAVEMAEGSHIVYKVHDDWSRRHFANRTDYRFVRGFHSYTWHRRVPYEGQYADAEVGRMHRPNDQALEYFAANGYTADELAEHAARGGVFFGLTHADRLAAVCGVYPNHGRVWEIAGVYTHPRCRQRGFGRRVVCAALRFCAEHGFQPRYQFHYENTGSRALAQSLGLIHVLTVDHYAPRLIQSA